MPVITYRTALREALAEEMERDPGVFIIGEEVAEYQGTFRVTEGLLERFGPLRVVDTPISEEGFTAVGVGAAMAGLRPVVEYMTINFCLRALDQIFNHAAKTCYMSNGQFPMPMVFRGPNGKGERLSAQHSQSLEAYFMHMPGLKVVLPATPADAKGLLKASIRDNNPVVFLEHAGLYNMKEEVPAGDVVVPLGQAAIRRQGRDCTLIAYSRMVHVCLRAAEQLAQEGIEAEVLDLRCLVPMDVAAIRDSVSRTHRAIVVAEDTRVGSAATEVASRVYETAFDELDAPVGILAGADVPMPYNRNLERLAVPDEAAVAQAVRQALWRSGNEPAEGMEEGNARADDAEDGRLHGGGDHRPLAQERR
jgi:pyruvate dehydrogenase E1 component beta subunit